MTRYRGRRVGQSLVVAAIAAATVAGLVARPDGGGGAEPGAEQVIVAGAAGLRWDDVDPERTPHLWRLAEGGSIGSLSVRSAHRPTCTADGWLTLGAGNWAADRAGGRWHAGAAGPGELCPPLDVTMETDDGGGALLRDQKFLVHYNQWDLPWGAVPGALAGSVECTAAFGEGAAVAAARSFGQVDRYQEQLPADPERAADAMESCELGIVDLGSVAGEGAPRVADARRVDATVGKLLAARPPGSLLVVAGVADADDGPHLYVAVADGPGLAPGWLTSATTGRTGYVQLVDLAPTVLAAIDRPPPEVPFAGGPVTIRPGRPAALSDAVAELVAADREAGRAGPVATGFLAALAAAQLALFAAVVPLLRRPNGANGSRPGAPAPNSGRNGAGPARRFRGWRSPHPTGTVPRLRGTVLSRLGGTVLSRLGGTVPGVLLVAAALAIPAALAAGAVPWWRAEAAGWVFAVTSLAVLAAAAGLVVRTPVFRRTLGLVGAAAAVAAAAVAADLLTGSWLQLNGVVGYSAHDGVRYAGLGDIGLGVLIAGTLLVAGCLAEQVPRRRRPLVMVAVGAPGVVLAGSPYLGADIGGAVAMIAGVCLAAALCTGGWLTLHRVAWATVAGVAVVAVVALFDLRQSADRRTGLGSMLGQVAEGTAGFGAQRLSLANAEALMGTPLTVLAVGAGAFLWFALLRPWGGLKRLFGVHPALRAGVIGAAVASLAGGILVGAALTVVGAAAAVGVPLVTLAALRLRQRSDRRAQALPTAAGAPDSVARRQRVP